MPKEINKLKRSAVCSLLCFLSLTACGPSEQRNATSEKQKLIDCSDKICAGDTEPKHSHLEAAIKVNNEWYIGPRKYFSSVSSAASFEWWDHKALDPAIRRPPAAQKKAKDGEGSDFAVDIFLRSTNRIYHMHSYQMIESAKANGWILDHKTLRLGLDRINIERPNGKSVKKLSYYVATELVDAEGRPPIAVCDHNNPFSGANTDFVWKYGIRVSARMSEKHCDDWPEIYLEINRILQLLRKS